MNVKKALEGGKKVRKKSWWWGRYIFQRKAEHPSGRIYTHHFFEDGEICPEKQIPEKDDEWELYNEEEHGEHMEKVWKEKKREEFKKYCWHAPIPVTKEWLKEQYDNKKLIPVKDLEHGKIYVGKCRNARLAVWNKEKDAFTYLRSKWGSEFLEDIDHVEIDTEYDMFLPHYLATEDEKGYEKLKEMLKKYEGFIIE